MDEITFKLIPTDRWMKWPFGEYHRDNGMDEVTFWIPTDILDSLDEMTFRWISTDR